MTRARPTAPERPPPTHEPVSRPAAPERPAHRRAPEKPAARPEAKPEPKPEAASREEALPTTNLRGPTPDEVLADPLVRTVLDVFQGEVKRIHPRPRGEETERRRDGETE